MREPPEPGVRGPALFAASLGLAGALAIVAPGPRLAAGWRVAGIIPAALGATLHWWAWRVFRARGVSVRDRTPPGTLITSGPYRWSRNPMLLAGGLILLGAGMLLGATTPFLVVPGYLWICRRCFVLPEERILSERFGSAYQSYRVRVRRWIGLRSPVHTGGPEG